MTLKEFNAVQDAIKSTELIAKPNLKDFNIKRMFRAGLGVYLIQISLLHDLNRLSDAEVSVLEEYVQDKINNLNIPDSAH